MQGSRYELSIRFRSTAFLSLAHLRNFKVLGSCLSEDVLVGKSRKSRSQVVLLAHLEVLSEVLVTAPPVQVDHAEALVASDLVEVGVPDVVLDTIGWESSVAVESPVRLVGLANPVAPVLDHPFLLVLDHRVEQETAPQVEDDHAPEETNTVLFVEWLHFPVDVAEGVLEEASNIFEGPPSLRIVARLFGVVDELEEVTICLLYTSDAADE